MASVGSALRRNCGRVAASSKSAGRAHTAHTLRCPASETVIHTARLSATDAVASVTSGLKFAGRAQASGLRSFGKCAKASPSPASVPPNKSFKPTPCRGFVETSRHAGNTGSHPPRSARLNSGVRRQKSVWWLCFPMLTFPASIGAALRSVSRHVSSSVKSIWRAHTSHALRWSASETVLGVGQCAATHAVISDRSG